MPLQQLFGLQIIVSLHLDHNDCKAFRLVYNLKWSRNTFNLGERRKHQWRCIRIFTVGCSIIMIYYGLWYISVKIIKLYFDHIAFSLLLIYVIYHKKISIYSSIYYISKSSNICSPLRRSFEEFSKVRKKSLQYFLFENWYPLNLYYILDIQVSSISDIYRKPM